MLHLHISFHHLEHHVGSKTNNHEVNQIRTSKQIHNISITTYLKMKKENQTSMKISYQTQRVERQQDQVEISSKPNGHGRVLSTVVYAFSSQDNKQNLIQLSCIYVEEEDKIFGSKTLYRGSLGG